MIVTILNWAYIFIICFSCGLLVRKTLEKTLGCDITSVDAVTVCGIVFAGIYAQVWSIFGGLGPAAYLVLFVSGLISIALNREKIREYCLLAVSDRGLVVRAVIFIVIFAALSSDVPGDYDTYLYHAQSIAWIEKFGLVKGLANLHNRFGYNSAFMCLQALFSFGFTGKSLHQLNGFICLFMTLFITEKGLLKKLKDPGAENILALSAVFYMIFMAGSISSPGSDMMTMQMLMYVLIKWTDLCHRGVRNGALFGCLAMMTLFISTLKLSAAPFFLLAVYPVFLLIREKRAKDIIKYFFSGLLIFLPFLIRNVLVSGYLLYPMESIDIFNVDWKVPEHVSRLDRAEISAFGKAIQGMEGDISLTGWVQIWFRNLESVPRLVFCIAVFCGLLYVLIILRCVTGREACEKRELFTAFVSGLSLVYWFLGSPNMRYGIALILIFSALVFGTYTRIEGRRAYMLFLAACMIFMILSYSDEYTRKNINLIYPEDYASFECREVVLEKEGAQVIVYTPVEGDQAGVDVFPATPEINPDYTELRGSSIRDGFRAVKK